MLSTVNFEMSLKPFKKTDGAYVKNVCVGLFEQWKPFLKGRKKVSVMLWSADGSEILEYNNDLDKCFEWGDFIGHGNLSGNYDKKRDPEGKSLHSRNYKYTENPPIMTYGTLKRIIEIIKETGCEILKVDDIFVGATFDPGSEFAESEFKYKRHTEILKGVGGDFICAYEKLHKDDHAYAGFPNGIPEGLPFGTFFGRQCKHFLKDMGFDYIWFSNGLGFGVEPWTADGAIFDGENFHIEDIDRIEKNVMEFWHLFREECPDIPIYTRGTNMSTGIDFASDGIPLATIYNEVDGIMPPPNSPWAALNCDYGLELMGHMSRIAKLPDDKILFRFYIHDPWWANSPWFDRYGGTPQDIYMPMALSSIDENGKVRTATDINILSVDNSWGNMPDFCVNEPVPHILKAEREEPDAPSPVVWVYPFDEYCAARTEEEINMMYSGDWFIRNAINNGFPLTSIISTDNFVKVDKGMFKDSVLVTPVPIGGSELEKTLFAYIKNGGKVLFYGGVNLASDEFKELIGVTTSDESAGFDALPITADGKNVGILKHERALTTCIINTKATDDKAFAFAGDWVIGTASENVAWLRATSTFSAYGQFAYADKGDKCINEKLMLTALAKLGYGIEVEKGDERAPIIMIHTHDGAMYFSVYAVSTTVKTSFKFPLGAPVLANTEAKMENGKSVYHFGKFTHAECRVFVEQEAGLVSVREIAPVTVEYDRRIMVAGLENATVRFLVKPGTTPHVVLTSDDEYYRNNDYWFVGDEFDGEMKDGYFEARNVSGNLVFSF